MRRSGLGIGLGVRLRHRQALLGKLPLLDFERGLHAAAVAALDLDRVASERLSRSMPISATEPPVTEKKLEAATVERTLRPRQVGANERETPDRHGRRLDGHGVRICRRIQSADHQRRCDRSSKHRRRTFRRARAVARARVEYAACRRVPLRPMTARRASPSFQTTA